MISQIEAKALSDNALDSAYVNAVDAQTRSIVSLEIIDRLSSVRSFITGTLGFTRFPKYNAGVASFKQVDAAQVSVSDNAKNVVSGIGTNLWSIALPIIIVVVILYVLSKKL